MQIAIMGKTKRKSKEKQNGITFKMVSKDFMIKTV